MAITNTTYLGLNKPDYDAIADIEVLNDNADIIDEQFDGTHLVTKVNNVTPVGGAVNINIGVSSVNGMTGAVTITERSVKQLIDIIYPVGSYYETTNANFNPNTAWAGTTWQRITDGRALIAGGGSSGYTVGSNYGEKTHTITSSELPTHNHTASTGAAGSHNHGGDTGNAGAHNHGGSTGTAGAHKHDRGNMNITGTFFGDNIGSSYNTGAFSYTGSSVTPGIVDNDDAPSRVVDFDASKTWTGETGSNGSHSHSISQQAAHHHSIPTQANHTHTVTVNNSGNSVAMSLVQPSAAVARWLRTA